MEIEIKRYGDKIVISSENCRAVKEDSQWHFEILKQFYFRPVGFTWGWVGNAEPWQVELIERLIKMNNN